MPFSQAHIFVVPFTRVDAFRQGILCSICDGTINQKKFPDFDPKTATECPLCGNPNKPEKDKTNA